MDLRVTESGIAGSLTLLLGPGEDGPSLTLAALAGMNRHLFEREASAILRVVIAVPEAAHLISRLDAVPLAWAPVLARVHGR